MVQLTIKRKIMIVLGIWFACTIPVGILVLEKVDQLGHSIDVIMRENYRSIIICEKVIDSLGQLDGSMIYQRQDDNLDPDFFQKKNDEIRKLWDEEISNATVKREKELAENVGKQLVSILESYREILEIKNENKQIKRITKDILPPSVNLQKDIMEILNMNQDRMHEADKIARAEAEDLFRIGVILFIACFIFLGFLGWLLTRWIHKPLCQLLSMSDAIADGNFSCVMQSGAGDEIGQLMRSFNGMAASLRSNMSSMEEKIRSSQQFSRDMLLTLPIPIALFSKNDGKMLFATDIAKKYLTFGHNENIMEHGAAWLRQLFRQVQQSGKAKISNERLSQCEDGMDKIFQVHATPLPTTVPPEAQTAVIFFLQDISSRLEQQDFKYRILAGFSAYFKEHIQNVLMSNYILTNDGCGPLNEKQQELLADINENAQKIADGISNITDFNFIPDSQRIHLRETCVAKDLLLHSAERCRHLASEAEISIKTECDADLPRVHISQEQFNKIIDMLFDNAVRFTPAGGIVKFAARHLGDEVEFSVADSGPGIPVDLRKIVFEPFYKKDSGKGHHRGLGLCIVRSIVLTNGGSIGIRDNDGGGAVVYFTIPAQKDTDELQDSNQDKESIC